MYTTRSSSSCSRGDFLPSADMDSTSLPTPFYLNVTLS
jgi:hypothetical protein